MKSTSWVALALFVGVAVGFVMAGGNIDRAANGQVAVEVPVAPAANAVPRFQMATWAVATNNTSAHGCYILDTITGEFWHAGDHAAVKVADELPKNLPERLRAKAK